MLSPLSVLWIIDLIDHMWNLTQICVQPRSVLCVTKEVKIWFGKPFRCKLFQLLVTLSTHFLELNTLGYGWCIPDVS